jgi:hypothetical protein
LTIDLIAVPGVTEGFGFVGGTIGAIIQIVVGIGLVYVYTGKIGGKDGVLLGIIVIVLGIIASSLLAIIGGILIIIDAL